MKIGYDAKRAFLNNTGLGNYSRWLIGSIANFYPQNDYFLYTPKIKPNPRVNFLKDFKNIQAVTPKSKRFTAWWRSKGIIKDLKRDDIQVYHGLSHELPSGIQKSGIKSVVTVHDAIVLRFPQYFGWINRAIYTTKLRYACHAADKVIAISEQTQKDLISLLNVPAGKIEVIYQGCDPAFKQTASTETKQQILKKYNLPDEFILNVGTVEERKNLLLLIQALPKVDKPTPLVVIGKHTAYANKVKQAIQELNLTARVIFLNNVDFADLPAIYQSAAVFVYPSRYEGFGIPILEAITSGTPVIGAKGSCLEEAGGPDSLYTNPDDAGDLATQLNLVLNDASQRAKMIAKGKEYSRNFDDDKLSAQLMSVYTPLLNGGAIMNANLK